MSEEIEELEICNSCLKDCVKGYSKLRSESDIMEAGIKKMGILIRDGYEIEMNDDGDVTLVSGFPWSVTTAPTFKELIMKIGEE